MQNFFKTKEAQKDQHVRSFFQNTITNEKYSSKFNLNDISSFQNQNENLENEYNIQQQINKNSYQNSQIKDKEQSEKTTPNFQLFKKSKSTNIINEDFNLNNQQKLQNCRKFFDCKKWKIEDFKIGKALGRGRFGRVYLAKVRKTGFIVALKIVSKPMIIKQNFQRQIYREIEIHSKLNHKNLIKMYGFFWDEQKLYYILEYAAYGEMYDKLNNQPLNRFQEKQVSQYMKQVIDAFIYLHSQNIMHRDLKPENILIGHDGIKIADFNWSVHCPSNNRKTYCGTFQYICPEMVNKKSYSNKMDLWCLGILCFELSTGYSPFESQDLKELSLKFKQLSKYLKYPNHLSNEIKDFMSSFLKIQSQNRMSLQQALRHGFIIKYN